MSTKRNSGTLVAGSILILFGLLALLGQIFRGFDFWGKLWPIVIIGFGLLFFVGMLLGGKSVAGLAIPGSIITIVGLMMFVQNLTGYWESWSYGWTVILIAIGFGLYIMGLYGGNQAPRRSGLRLMKTGLMLFIIFGAFFELIFSATQPFGLRQVVFPAALILVGIYLIIDRSGFLGHRMEGGGTPPEDHLPGQ
jgi:hypothetical protein